MDRFLNRVLPQLKEHLTDDRLGSVLCGELTLFDNFLAKRHIAGCQLCRIRLENIEQRADRVVTRFQTQLERKDAPVPPDDTEQFLMRLDRDFADYVPKKRYSFRRFLTLPEFPSMNPALTTAMMLAIASAIFVGFHVWNQQRAPRISSNALLVHAEKWDTANFAETSRVVYQAVKIKSGQQTLERKIYRDTQGRRRLRQVALDNEQEGLKGRMATAGIDWDEPLSASSYQEWHDRQHIREDGVSRGGSHLLVLTTTSPLGPVAEQTLTVRDFDFHPVRRTVEFRDSRTVEIAELDFKVLPWSAVDASLFESLVSPEMTASSASAPRVLPFRLPSLMTPGQLDEAELGARLVLNQLHADTGERIEIERSADGVEVKGLVDTDQRKAELKTQLSLVPHVSVAIQSIDDLKKHPQPEGEAPAPQIFSAAAQPSPLETYFLSRSRSVSDVSELSRQLVNDALTVDQEGRALTGLLNRFGSGESTTVMTSATLSELVFSHRERLLAALDAEEATLSKLGVATDASSGTASAKTLPLVDAAEKNLSLCNELTVGGSSSSRSAASIVAELTASLNGVRKSALETKLASPHTSASTGSK